MDSLEKAPARTGKGATDAEPRESHLAPAILSRETGRYGEARAWLKEWLGTHPEDAEALSLLAQVCLLDKKYDEAKTALLSARAIAPELPSVLRNQARLLLKEAKPADALVAAQSAYGNSPNDAETWLVLAAALSANQKDIESRQLIERALQARPDYAEALANRALLRLRAKDTAGALADAERALAVKPHLAPVWAFLAMLRFQSKDVSGAIAALAEAHALEPENVSYVIDLGAFLRQNKQVDEAIAVLRAAVEQSPDNASAWTGYAMALHDAERLDEARAAHERAHAIDPESAAIANNLGALAVDQKEWESALRYFDRALAIAPGRVEILCNRAAALIRLGRLDEAEASYRLAIGLKPDHADVHVRLGDTLRSLGRLDEAEASYRLAIALKSDHADVYVKLGHTLRVLGRTEEAAASYRLAFALEPDAPQYAYLAELLLPKISVSRASIADWRHRFQAGIQKLESLELYLRDPSHHIPARAYDLAYHNEGDRQLMTQLCRLFRHKAPSLDFVASHVANWQLPTNRRIRVGFCSAYFRITHTIGSLYQGLLKNIDRTRFEVTLFHAPSGKRDTFGTAPEELGDSAVQLPADLSTQQQAIAEKQLDVLFYPDIGMSPATYFLAFARLAPVQIVGWGHPDTTGIDTVDYFVSSQSIEPADSDEHYSERLVRMNRLPCFYQPRLAPTEIPARAQMGLPETGTLYGCPQSLSKFHPDFDPILAEIAEGDPDGHIVLVRDKASQWTKLLKARWAATHPILSDRVVFLPRQPLNSFMALMAHFDILLDPIHFGSGNTMYEAMVYGTPIVTWPGRFMRGRIVAGAYRQMGLNDAPVAADIEDYAPLALALGRDAERRRRLRQAALRAAGKELFADMGAVREFEQFVAAAVDAAAHGETLPRGWRPSVMKATATVLKDASA